MPDGAPPALGKILLFQPAIAEQKGLQEMRGEVMESFFPAIGVRRVSAEFKG